MDQSGKFSQRREEGKGAPSLNEPLKSFQGTLEPIFPSKAGPRRAEGEFTCIKPLLVHQTPKISLFLGSWRKRFDAEIWIPWSCPEIVEINNAYLPL